MVNPEMGGILGGNTPDVGGSNTEVVLVEGTPSPEGYSPKGLEDSQNSPLVENPRNIRHRLRSASNQKSQPISRAMSEAPPVNTKGSLSKHLKNLRPSSGLFIYCEGFFRGAGMLQRVNALRDENEGLMSELKTSQTIAAELRCRGSYDWSIYLEGDEDVTWAFMVEFATVDDAEVKVDAEVKKKVEAEKVDMDQTKEGQVEELKSDEKRCCS
ncbi:hypothetical protein Hanom_Chr09g00793831 [Helianthus anomalus]